MPHLVVLYTPNLDALSDMTQLCRHLADAMLLVRDESGAQVYPTGGTRVLAYAATHYAIADGGKAGKAAGGTGEYGFVYLNLRMARGRSQSTQQAAGAALSEVVKAHFEALLKTHQLGITVQIDEGHEVFDAKHSSLHPLFKKP
jgi:5-carboxymethyl-2-hydroxymuconate isomerase